MITMNIIGQYIGDDQNKTYQDKAYLYVKPVVAAPDGMLRKVRCVPPKFGAAVEMEQQLGNIAVICGANQIPDISIGERVSLTVSYWSVMRPFWSARDKTVVYGGDPNSLYVLESEVKPTQAKAAPFGFSFTGQCRHRHLVDENTIEAQFENDATPPEWLLRRVKVKAGFNYESATEKPGTIKCGMNIDFAGKIRKDGQVEVKGVCWPVLTPYWDVEAGGAKMPIVPVPVLQVTDVNAVGNQAQAPRGKQAATATATE